MRILKTLLSLIVLAIIMSGCAYNFILEEEVVDPTDPDAPEVSFSTEIVPIFEAKCTTCHNGSRTPDLTPENAYNSLNSSRYINTDSPEESLIYTKPHPDGDHIPYSEAQAALVLTWIAQGAQPN
ncbi:MAG TPA: hypothetical protein VEP89_06265 [Draconibacterium sp.]|nr:hypothetical protein [Draconibacterium sp.]